MNIFRTYWTRACGLWTAPVITGQTKLGLLGFSALSFFVVVKSQWQKSEVERDIALRKERMAMVGVR